MIQWWVILFEWLLFQRGSTRHRSVHNRCRLRQIRNAHLRGIYKTPNSPFARPAALGLFILLFITSNYCTYIWASNYFVPMFAVSSIILGYVIFREFEAFWRLGFLGADRTIKTGINYCKALHMCKDSLEFLGIGASKLIAEGQCFNDAITRCHRDDRPIKLLICPPDHPELLVIARRAGHPDSQYQDTVTRSLRALSDLKIKQSRNIEVRFYSELPLFRLMFINDNICLLSHYILGEGDGSQLPQLHIWKKPPGRRDIESFYYPLKKFFDKTWEKAMPWDFKTYL